MSTQARASLEQMRRLAGATILQLAPGNDIAARNALTIASLLQRSGARPIIAGMLKHLSSSISYGGAASLGELKKMFWDRPEDYIIRLSDAARRESFDR